jgi:hypothetical protein
MDLNRANVEVWKRRFLRLYSANLAGLKTLADSFASEASETVTLTNFGEDGQSGGGIITGNKMELLAAAEELIEELETQPAPQPTARGLVMQFGS